MYVILKKTKITNAILKQTLKSTPNDLKLGEILGWCMYGSKNKSKYFVCFRSDINSISIYPVFKEIVLIEPTETNHLKYWKAEVIRGGNYTPLTYNCDNENDALDFQALLEKAKNQAEIKGQFFI